MTDSSSKSVPCVSSHAAPSLGTLTPSWEHHPSHSPKDHQNWVFVNYVPVNFWQMPHYPITKVSHEQQVHSLPYALPPLADCETEDVAGVPLLRLSRIAEWKVLSTWPTFTCHSLSFPIIDITLICNFNATFIVYDMLSFGKFWQEYSYTCS